ncbi:MAG TPA: hydroxysqualene dehydroxylase HpnE [Bryobacteraceae bacterium]|nr:hydroxysqualene dehydroxylase HpnE [Bryobacteraceae bacterium]
MDVIVVGGGLAGLSAAAALASAGRRVRVLEGRPYLGGRAASYEAGGETIDNCQHILLRCCINLQDFYRRLGVEGDIAFYRDFTFIEPGGRQSVMRRSLRSFLALPFLSWSDKLAIARGLAAAGWEYARRADLDFITMLDWLKEKRQPPRAIGRFWRQVLVSAISEELDRMAARHGLQVFKLGFLAAPDAHEFGVPTVPLGKLYSSEAWRRFQGVEILLRASAQAFNLRDGQVASVATSAGEFRADAYVCAVPFERLAALGVPVDVSGMEHSPITGIHLWFDRPVTDLPQATLLDRTIQWMFNKSEGRYVQIVVSASRSLVEMPRAEVIALALRELAEFFPAVREAKLEKAHVVKEVRAVFSAQPGLESRRPPARTAIKNLFLAGDWTRSGWPATMEGAVRSGYLAAEAIAGQRFLRPDPA